jgi:hypothetical protein
MSSVFSKILSDASSRSALSTKEALAKKWLRDTSAKTSAKASLVITQSRDRYRNKVLPGRCYLYQYDPKTKGKLPYYDMYPIVFPFEKTSEGFLGLNFHYIPLQYRAILLDNLYPLINNNKMDETTRLKMSYKILSSASRFKYYKPCIKHYLNKHVRSRFIYIKPEEWNVALFLPIQKFVGASVNTVYKDSQKIIRES